MHAIVLPLKQLLDAGFPVEHVIAEGEKLLVALETMEATEETAKAYNDLTDFVNYIKIIV